MQAQRALADELTTLVHGADECAGGRSPPRRRCSARARLQELDAAHAGEPRSPRSRRPRCPALGASLVDLLAAERPGASRSRRRAARSKEGGAYLNNVRVTDEAYVPSSGDLLHGRFLVLRRGKRTVGGVEIAAG